jgi:hypothetical protein
VFARPLAFALLALGLAARDAQSDPAAPEPEPPPRIDGSTADQRLDAFARFCATVDPIPAADARGKMAFLAARVAGGRDVPASLDAWGAIAAKVFATSKARLDANPRDNNARNPFEKHALIHAYVICRDQAAIPEPLVADMKRYVALYKHREWFGYGALNYRLMNDGAGFVAAELWPDLVDSDGLDAAGIRDATRARLFGYFDEITRYNTDEFGAPTYLGIDLSAMKLLADFAADPEMRRRASLTLDAMLLQVACAWNRGYYVTPASRAKYWGSSTTGPDAMDTTAGIGWLYFGGHRPVAPGQMNPGGSFWFTARKTYRPPDLLVAVANDRTAPFLHFGSARERVRFSIYHSEGYSLASQWESVSDPNAAIYKEARRNMLKWASDKPRSTFVPLQDNPQRPYRLADGKRNAFGYGENPFSQSLQHQGTLIGIAAVPENYPHWKMYAPFTTEGAILRRIVRGGWVFCHGGSALFAFRYAAPAYWDKPREKERCDVLRSDSRVNAWALETAKPAAFPAGSPEQTLDAFAAAVLAKTRFDASALHSPSPKIAFRSLAGNLLELRFRPHKEPYANHHAIDGKPVDYAAFPLLGNPWMHQPLGGETLAIRHGAQTLTYDFKNWTRTESAPEPKSTASR